MHLGHQLMEKYVSVEKADSMHDIKRLLVKKYHRFVRHFKTKVDLSVLYSKVISFFFLRNLALFHIYSA